MHLEIRLTRRFERQTFPSPERIYKAKLEIMEYGEGIVEQSNGCFSILETLTKILAFVVLF